MGLPNCLPMPKFQSAPPVKGAMGYYNGRKCVFKFQSAPPVKGAIGTSPVASHKRHVSIRAPREGGDINVWIIEPLCSVSIRAPREGGDESIVKFSPS